MAVATAWVTPALGACTADEEPIEDTTPTARLEETLRVGSVEGDLSFGTILNVARGPGGRTYVVEPVGSRVSILDSDGTRVGTVGGAGMGPGEFARPGRMGWVGDTLWILDGANYRFSLFSPAGEFIGEVNPQIAERQDPSDIPPRPVGLLPGGVLFARTSVPSHLVAQGVIDSLTYYSLDRDGAILRELHRTRATPPLWIHNPDSQNPISGRFKAQPFVTGELVVPSPDGAFVTASASEGRTVVTKISLDLDTMWSRTLPVHPPPLSEATIDSLIEAESESFARSPAAEGATAARIATWVRDALVTPEVRPGLEEMVVGHDASIWIAHPDTAGARQWVVLSSDGRVQARAALSREVTVFDGWENGLIGVVHDALDVPRIVRYELRDAG